MVGWGGLFFLTKPRLAQTGAKPGFPIRAIRKLHKSKDRSSQPKAAGGGSWAWRRLTWGLVLLEGVIDEWEENHDGGIRLLGVLHQVTLLEIFLLLLQLIVGEGDVLHGAVLTGLFHGLEYHGRTCLSIRRGGSG